MTNWDWSKMSPTIYTNPIAALKTSYAGSIIKTCGGVVHVVARDLTDVFAEVESEFWKLSVAREEIQAGVPISIRRPPDSVVLSGDGILCEEKQPSIKLVYWSRSTRVDE
jgi:hypothetical protein